MRHLWLVAVLLLTAPDPLVAQNPTASPLDWWGADSDRVAFVTTHGHAFRRTHLVVWAPIDSLDSHWLSAFVDSLDASLAAVKALLRGPYPWQRIGDRPVVYVFSPGRFISHASGQDTVFISLDHIRRGEAPYLHEAAHELIVPAPPFYPSEYPDSMEEVRRAATFPQWLSEGLPDYLAQAVAESNGFREGDIFAIGGLAKADSTCGARLAVNPRRAEIVAKVGGLGRLEALSTTDRAEVASAFYACSQSFTRYLVNRIGMRAVVNLFPAIPRDTWLAELTSAAQSTLPALRRAWLDTLGVRIDPQY